MKILDVKSLAIPDVKIIRIGRFGDDRGYFTEVMRAEDLQSQADIPSLTNVSWTQVNESYSHQGVMRGLHFQWGPHQGKLARSTWGEMIDMALDIRTGSATEGKIVGVRLNYDPAHDTQDLIWIPPGFAHGFMAVTECRLEYICTGSWAPQTERAIRFTDSSIDWSTMDTHLADTVRSHIPHATIAVKDREGLTLDAWRSSADRLEFTRTLPR